MHYVIFLAYAGSLAIAAEIAGSFIVLSIGQLLLGLSFLLTVPLMVLTDFVREARLKVCLVHFIIAVAVHPAVTMDSSYRDAEDQLAALAQVNSRGQGLKDADRHRLSLSLAQSLRDRTSDRLRFRSPLMYWAFPPTVALAVWGVLLYFLLPAGPFGKGRNESA